LVIVLLVAIGIGREIYKAQHAFAEQHFSLSSVDFRWLILAGCAYLLGMLPMGLFWYFVMRSLQQRPRLSEALKAFYIGHLGKYVPGKAMVVVLRTGLVCSPRVDTIVAGVSVFIETLTMMAVGAFLAAVIIAVRFAHHWPLLLLAVGLMLCAGIPTLPPIFRRLVYLLKVRKLNPEIGDLLEGLTFKLMVAGWLGNLAGWTLFGVSLWATVRCMPGSEPISIAASLPLLTATVCLAMVAGFLSLLPGGVGVREYIIMTLMQGPFGPVVAIVSAVLLRVAWLAAEVVLAGVLYLAVPSPSAAPAAIGESSTGQTAAGAGPPTEGTRA
jgi:uncharacterized membrane protein YbhN (UPF0104 family)